MYDIVYKFQEMLTFIVAKKGKIMAEATKVQKSEKKGGSSLLLIIVAVILFLILIGAAVVGYIYLNSDNEVLQDARQATQQEMAVKQQSASAKKSRSTNYLEIGAMYPLDKFIVNLLSESGGRYLKVSLNFELSTEDLGAELDQKQPLIRDIVIRTLSAKTYEEISTIRGKENLKDEVVAKVNQVLVEGQINNLFFTDFVIQ